MKAVEHDGQFLAIDDISRKITKAHLDSVCNIHKGSCTCRYIGLGANGFICMKLTKAKSSLDKMVASEQMVARGDNCEGLGSPEELTTPKQPGQ